MNTRQVASAVVACSLITACAPNPQPADPEKTNVPEAHPPQTTAPLDNTPQPTPSDLPPKPMSEEVYHEYMKDSGLNYDKKLRTITVTFHGDGAALATIDKAKEQNVSLPYTTDITSDDYFIYAAAIARDRGPLTCSVYYQDKLLFEGTSSPNGVVSCPAPGQLLQDIDEGKVIL